MENTKRLVGLHRILGVLILVWMGMIFFFSAQDAQESSKLSNGVTEAVVQVVVKDYQKKTPQQKMDIMKIARYVVRKLAHFSEYFLLAVMVFFWILWYDKKRGQVAFLSWMFTTLYACTDEAHQHFSSGRAPQWQDVGIDSSGALLGVLLTILVIWIIGKWRSEWLRRKSLSA